MPHFVSNILPVSFIMGVRLCRYFNPKECQGTSD